MSSSENTKKNLKFFLIGLAVLIILALAGVLGFGLYRVYAKTATDNFTLTVAKVFRLPALKVYGQTVTYADFADDLKAIHVMKQFDQKQNGPTAELSEEQMSDQVLWRLVNNLVINGLAREYGLKVEQKDVDELKTKILGQFKSAEEANKELADRYGWNLEIYEKKVMRPFVLQTKLEEKMQTDETLKTKVKEAAQTVLDQIKQGADFAELAVKYGEDGTSQTGGSLGFFARGEMVPEFEDAAFALKKGELAPNLVETQFGYHIIRVDDRKTEKVKDAKGKTSEVEKVSASHILFRYSSLEKYLQAQSRDLTKGDLVRLYLKVHNPFTASGSQE